MEMIINPKLREEIHQKAEYISSNSMAYDAKTRVVRDSLSALGDVYSFWIEHPDLRKQLFHGDRNPETVRKLAKKGIRNIKNAWYFLADYGRNMDFYLMMNPRIIKRVNAIVNGTRGEQEFRKKRVTLNFEAYVPPSPEKVSDLVSQSFENTTDIYRQDPLEGAIYAHLSLALIQPFDEGNKRTARLMQDRLLFDRGLLPAIIPAGEGKFYLSLLERASNGFNKNHLTGNPENQSEFFNYIASKVNNGLDMVLDDLNVDGS